jgi:hypothetical protein
LIPDVRALRSLSATLKADVKKDPELAKRFAKDPRAVMGERGLSRDVQNEMLVELGRTRLIPGGNPAADCVGTCGCSGCCWTGKSQLQDMLILVARFR